MNQLKFIREYINESTQKNFSIKDIKSLDYMPHIDLKPILPYINELRELKTIFGNKTSPVKKVELDLPKLEILTLPDAQIESLTLNCPNLKKLNLNKNNLTKLPSINKLEFLNIYRNPLENIEIKSNHLKKIICGHPSFESASLDCPQLELFSCAFQRFNHLKLNILEKSTISIKGELNLNSVDDKTLALIKKNHIDYNLLENTQMSKL